MVGCHVDGVYKRYFSLFTMPNDKKGVLYQKELLVQSLKARIVVANLKSCMRLILP